MKTELNYMQHYNITLSLCIITHAFKSTYNSLYWNTKMFKLIRLQFIPQANTIIYRTNGLSW